MVCTYTIDQTLMIPSRSIRNRRCPINRVSNFNFAIGQQRLIVNISIQRTSQFLDTRCAIDLVHARRHIVFIGDNNLVARGAAVRRVVGSPGNRLLETRGIVRTG